MINFDFVIRLFCFNMTENIDLKTNKQISYRTFFQGLELHKIVITEREKTEIII